MFGEAELKNVKQGEIIQLQRKGFFRCDVTYAPMSDFTSRERPLILFYVPDGHTNSSPISATASKETSNKETSKSNKAVSISAYVFNLYYQQSYHNNKKKCIL